VHDAVGDVDDECHGAGRAGSNQQVVARLHLGWVRRMVEEVQGGPLSSTVFRSTARSTGSVRDGSLTSRRRHVTVVRVVSPLVIGARKPGEPVVEVAVKGKGDVRRPERRHYLDAGLDQYRHAVHEEHREAFELIDSQIVDLLVARA
jgi:hypothetical protein